LFFHWSSSKSGMAGLAGDRREKSSDSYNTRQLPKAKNNPVGETFGARGGP
jgi:hypothetical protein